ncbi:MAG: DinB family protein [Dehalococcoidia bacterium]
MSDIEAIQRDLQDARAELLASLGGVTQEDLDRRPPGEITDDEQRWPIVQVLWHVGQVEDRFRRSIDQALDGRAVLADPPRARPAHLSTPPLLLQWLEQTRRPTEALLRRMTDADLDLEIVRPDGSTRTPRRFLALLVNHDRDHATQVRALRVLDALPETGGA